MNPMLQKAAAGLENGQSISFGSSLPGFSVDGSSSFSVSIWALFPSFAAAGTLFSKGSLFQLGLQDNQFTFSLPGTPEPSIVYLALEANSWYNLTLTFEALGGGSATVAIYVNGAALVGPTMVGGIGGSDNQDDYLVGGNLAADVSSVCLWSTAISAETVSETLWQVPAPGTPGLVACYCFNEGTPVDHSGNGNPVYLQNGAALYYVTPCLHLQGTAYAVPSAADGLNPGSGTTPFSIAAWISPDTYSGTAPMVFANGSQNSAGSLLCSLSWGLATGTWFFLVQRGVATELTSQGSFAPGEWHHVAVTYDGETLTLYVDGQASGSVASGDAGSLATPTPTIGAERFPSDAAGSYFQGYLQAVQVWSVALSAAQVQQYMYTDPGVMPTWNDDCVGDFRLGPNDTLNGMTGQPVALMNGAKAVEVVTPVGAPPLPMARREPHPSLMLPRPRSVVAAALEKVARMDIDTSVRPTSKLLGDAGIDVDELVAWYDRLLERALVPVDDRPRLRQLFLRNLYGGIRLTEQGELSAPFTVEREGDEVVLYGRWPSGRTELYRAAEEESCSVWLASVVGGLVVIVLDVLGVALGPASTCTKFFEGMVKRSANLGEDVAAAFAKASTLIEEAKAVIEVLQHLGGLVTAIINSMASAPWWSWVFAVGEIALEVLALVVSDGALVAVLIAKLIVALADWALQVNNPPSGGCFGWSGIHGSAAAGAASA